jgi:tetratricopeptide (TPR) repeat protein
VRPFASTSRYGSQPADLAAVGRELHVTHVVAGGFLLEKQNLQINFELVDVAQNQIVWREQITASPQALIAMHNQLANRAAQGLLPAMNVPAISPGDVPSPENEQAFALFMHSLTIPLDPGPNLAAIQQLERSVSLDSRYAPAWAQLSWRYYIDHHNGNGGEAALAKSVEAFKRQSKLDPSQPPVSTTLRTETGDLDGAYDQAADFLRRRPDLSMAHFWMSYVLRYAGLLDEAGKECDAALAIDPGFNVLRSCATTFIEAGDYPHAMRYIQVDEKGFGALSRMRIALRTGDAAAALTESAAAAQSGYRSTDSKLARLFLSHVPDGELKKVVAEVEADPVAAQDPEMLYQNAEVLAFCGQADAALRQLRRAIKGNGCSYPAMDKTPMFNSIRQRPEFAELRQAAVQCQQNFLAHRRQVDASFTAGK